VIRRRRLSVLLSAFDIVTPRFQFILSRRLRFAAPSLTLGPGARRPPESRRTRANVPDGNSVGTLAAFAPNPVAQYHSDAMDIKLRRVSPTEVRQPHFTMSPFTPAASYPGALVCAYLPNQLCSPPLGHMSNTPAPWRFERFASALR
jgi:hypothetical protein